MTSTSVGPPTNSTDGSSSYLSGDNSIRSWLLTRDHKRIAIMYLASTLIAFLFGGVLALLIRLQLIRPGYTIMGEETYNKVFTLHGAVMIFLFIIPSIPSALGNFLIPLMIGAREVAFPRLNLFGLYLYWFGASFTLAALITGAVDTGWTFYTPFSVRSNTQVMMTTFGIFVLGFSSILTGLNFIVTVNNLRAPGVTWMKLPLFVWGSYATAIIQVVATPVLAITLLLLITERLFSIGIFDPALGGDPVLFQHFFWFYSHPAVYIMILPGMAIISEIIPTFSRKTMFGYKMVFLASIAIAVIGFLVWGHHMFVSGQSPFADIIFSFLTFLVAVPSGIKVFNWVATMYRGSISFDTPMLYAISFLIQFTVGGLTGLFLGALAVDVHLHDTYFVVAHFHYVMMGGTVIAFIGGLHYWWPKMFGRMYSEFWGKVACGIIFLGFNMTFFPQFILGSQGMPRRYHKYFQQYQPLHQFSSVGSWVLGAGLFLVLIYLAASLVNGKRASNNPWGGTTLEWMTSSPPPPDNFEQIPMAVRDPYDYRPLAEIGAEA